MVKRYKKKRGRKKKFTKDFKEHLRIGLTAAVGFTIAFAWREPLILMVNSFASKVLKSTIEYQASIWSAFIITFIGVIIIWYLSRILR
jgi:hypothetical protein